MITTIRNSVKQSTSQALMFFLFCAFIIGLIVPSIMKQDGNTPLTWIIKVNGKEIPYKTFVREMQIQANFLAHIKQQYGAIADMLLQSMNIPTDPKTGAFDKLVRQELLDQYIDSLGVVVHPDYISKCISNAAYAQQYLGIPSFVYDNHGVLQKNMLEHYLKQQALSVQEFEKSIVQTIKRYHVLRLIFSTHYIPQFEIIENYKAHNLGKQFSYLHFSLDSFLKKVKNNPVTEEELQAFFDAENTQYRKYFIPEKRDGIVWRFEPDSYGISISDEEITNYYESNKIQLYGDKPSAVYVRHITEKQLEGTNETIESVREMLLNDTSSQWSKKWVDLDPIVRNEKNNAVEKAALLLKKEKDISSVIETKDGKVILQLIKRVPKTYKPLGVVKSDIIKVLTDKKFKTLFVSDFKKELASGSGQIETFIVEKKGKKEQIKDVEKKNDKISQELFSLKKGEYAFFIEDSVGIIIKLTEKVDRYLPTLGSIKDTVQNDFYHKKAHTALASLVKQVQKSAEQGVSFDELQKTFSGELEKTDMIKQNDTKIIKQLEQKGLPVRMLLNFEKVGSLVVHHTEHDSFLIKVDVIEEFNPNAFSDAQTDIKDQMERVYGGQLQEALVASLYKNATIETNNSLFIPSEEYSE